MYTDRDAHWSCGNVRFEPKLATDDTESLRDILSRRGAPHNYHSSTMSTHTRENVCGVCTDMNSERETCAGFVIARIAKHDLPGNATSKIDAKTFLTNLGRCSNLMSRYQCCCVTRWAGVTHPAGLSVFRLE